MSADFFVFKGWYVVDALGPVWLVTWLVNKFVLREMEMKQWVKVLRLIKLEATCFFLPDSESHG